MWTKIIQEILDTGMTQTQIAHAVSLEQPTISDLLRGKIVEPRYSNGMAIMALHKRVTKKLRKAA